MGKKPIIAGKRSIQRFIERTIVFLIRIPSNSYKELSGFRNIESPPALRPPVLLCRNVKGCVDSVTDDCQMIDRNPKSIPGKVPFVIRNVVRHPDSSQNGLDSIEERLLAATCPCHTVVGVRCVNRWGKK